jgi:hypothetical protein
MCCIAQSDAGAIKTLLKVHLIAQSIVQKRAKLKLNKPLKSGASQRSNKSKVNS